MLLRILKLLGLDVPAKIAGLRVKFEERVEFAKDHVKEATQTAAIVAVLLALAALAIVAALGVALVALYWWVASAYGQFYGLAAVIGVLAFIAITLIVIVVVVIKTRPADVATRAAQRRLKRAMEEARLEDVDAATASLSSDATPKSIDTAALPPPSATASDLIEPLALILSKFIKLPTTGNVALEELLVPLRGAARSFADEAMEGVANTVRYGERSKLFAILGASVLLGWWLAHRPPKNQP
jgi:uncharacterized membrane protein